MTVDPFRTGPPCGCPDLHAVIAAELEHRERPLCPTHDAGAIAQRQLDTDRAALELDAAARDAALTRVVDRWGQEAADANAARRAQARAQALEDLGQTDPLLANLTRAIGADLPLNASAGDFARHLGGGFTVDTDPGPLDAA